MRKKYRESPSRPPPLRTHPCRNNQQAFPKPLFSFSSVHSARPLSPRVICATTLPEKVMLTGSRFLAGVLYGSLSVSVVSKCYASRAYLHHSWLGTVLDFEPAHDLHTCELCLFLGRQAPPTDLVDCMAGMCVHGEASLRCTR